MTFILPERYFLVAYDGAMSFMYAVIE